MRARIYLCGLMMLGLGAMATAQQAPLVMPQREAQNVASPPSGIKLSVADSFVVDDVIAQLPSEQDANGKSVKPTLVYASQPYEEGGKTSRFLIVSYALYGDCHACGVLIAGGVFSKKQTQWVLSDWTGAVTTFGVYGKLSGSAEALILPGHAAVMLTESDWGQGAQSSFVSLLAVVNGAVTEVWSGLTAEDATAGAICDPPKCPKWSASLSALSINTSGWPNLQYKVAGVGARSDGSIGNVDRTQILVFNGTKYTFSSPGDDPAGKASPVSNLATSSSTNGDGK